MRVLHGGAGVIRLFLPLCLVVTVTKPTTAEEVEYKGLICRGVEESGRLLIGQPGFGPHIVSLFVTGPNPLSATHTLAEHVAWVNDPLHSYVADGTGGLCVWAHPSSRDARAILALPGLAGLEVHYAGDGTSRDALWDEVLLGCCEAKRPFLWAFAADDTHSRTRINLSWYAARVGKVDESSLKAALRSGAFYVSNGPAIADIAVRGRTITLQLEQESDVVWLRAGQHLGAAPAAELTATKELGENRCLQWDRAVRTASLELEALGIPWEELKFVRAVVRTAPERLVLTQPWRVNGAGVIDNPYPAAGVWVRGQTHNHTDAPPGNHMTVKEFRLAYQAQGQLGSFATDYSYWETPYQWLPGDGAPQIQLVMPPRCREGETVEAVIRGMNFKTGAKVQIGGQTLALLANNSEELRVRLPSDLPPGIYDLCVTNPDRFRDTLTQGFTVQKRDADNTGWRSFTEADGLAYLRSTCAACFGEEVWIGSLGGVSRYKEGKWTVFKKEIPGRSAYAMVADPGGGLWIAGGSGLAFCSTAGEWSSHTVGQADKLRGSRASERWGRLAFDSEGSLWVTNRWAAGLGLRRQGAWQRLTTQDGIPSDAQGAVVCNSEGTVWVGFGNGLHKLVGGKWTKVTLPAGLAECSFVSAMATRTDGSVWAAVTSESQPQIGGVVRLRGEEAVAYRPTDSPLPSARVRDVLVTQSGDVWFASDLGVARLNHSGKWRTFTSVNSGLGCNVVLGLAEDSKGRIWFATAQGASCLDVKRS